VVVWGVGWDVGVGLNVAKVIGCGLQTQAISSCNSCFVLKGKALKEKESEGKFKAALTANNTKVFIW
jgi:hypothetical protein